MVRIRSKPSRSAFFAGVICLLLSSIPSDCQTKEPTRTFTVPELTSLKIRLESTLTSTYSQIGDPFTATVVDQGPYEGAKVYGSVSSIQQSGRIKGNTSMVLRFTRLRIRTVGKPGSMPRLFDSITLLPENRWTWKVPLNQAVGARSPPNTPPLGLGRAPCLVRSSVGVRVPESGRLSAGPAVWGQWRLRDAKR